MYRYASDRRKFAGLRSLRLSRLNLLFQKALEDRAVSESTQETLFIRKDTLTIRSDCEVGRTMKSRKNIEDFGAGVTSFITLVLV
ncbi:hypothetical protein AYI69_g5940 [Smittium culicis]|uniref:Uncharacterized protein n=1 Tax=Smittium culicis TaxID=133412 RepID=A0A1R1Y2S5_9FUNG|nr:hypothetical protein AYI69_g5940 [Smittium culicis]